MARTQRQPVAAKGPGQSRRERDPQLAGRRLRRRPHQPGGAYRGAAAQARDPGHPPPGSAVRFTLSLSHPEQRPRRRLDPPGISRAVDADRRGTVQKRQSGRATAAAQVPPRTVATGRRSPLLQAQPAPGANPGRAVSGRHEQPRCRQADPQPDRQVAGLVGPDPPGNPRAALRRILARQPRPGAGADPQGPGQDGRPVRSL